MTLHDYLHRFGKLRHLRAEEFLVSDPRNHDRGHAGFLLNGPAPEDAWENMLQLAMAWDEVAGRCGRVRISICSCYRTRAFDVAAGGHGDSPHAFGRAADAVSDDPSRVVVAARCLFASGEGVRGRVALDHRTGIVHLDVSDSDREISLCRH